MLGGSTGWIHHLWAPEQNENVGPLLRNDWDFPGGPVVKTPSFHCRGRGFNPWWGTKIPKAVRCSQKKKTQNKMIRNFKRATAEQQTKHGALLNTGQKTQGAGPVGGKSVPRMLGWG